MKKTTWINDNGNLCFFWEGDSYKGVLCFFSAILIVLIVSGIIDYFWVKWICSRVLIGVFIAMFIAYNYVSNKKDAIRRTRQTLWRGGADANPKTCCQTIHDCQKVVPLHYESEWQYKHV